MQYRSLGHVYRLLTALILVSMLIPANLLAQFATPIADPSPTPTAEVASTPDDDGTDVQPAASPTAEPTSAPPPLAKRSSFNVGLFSTNVPQTTVNGVTADAVVASGSLVTIGFVGDGEVEVGRFANADCSGDAVSWSASSYGYAFGAGTYSVQARSLTDTSNVGPCLKITAVQSPNITFQGSLGPFYVVVGTEMTTEVPADSVWTTYGNATCTGSPISGSFTSPDTFRYTTPTTVWFQANHIQYPQIKGTCVEVNWVNAPELKMNDSAVSLTLVIDTPVTPSFPSGSAWNTYANAGCIQENLTQTDSTSTTPFTSSSHVTRSYQAHLLVAPQIVGNCVTVTWRPATPSLTVNGQAGPVILQNGVVAEPVVSTGAEWGIFTGVGCQESATWYTSSSILAPDNAIRSFQARWSDAPESLSNCVNVTWVSTPSLTVDGSVGPLMLPTGRDVALEFPPGAMWSAYTGADCQGNPEGFTDSTAAFTKPDGTYSFRARWGTNDATLGNCLTIRWSGAPQLTINGSSDRAIVLPGTGVTPVIPDGAEWTYFKSANCSGSPAQSWGTDLTAVSSDGYAVWSFRARWGTDDATRGNCVTVTWRPATPTVTANSKTTSFEIQAGVGSVTIPEISGATIDAFDGASCRAISFIDSSSGGWNVSPSWAGVSISFQAYWDGDPNTRGNCLTVTWRDAPTVFVDGRTSSFTVPLDTIVTAITSPDAGLAVVGTAHCAAIGANQFDPNLGDGPTSWSAASALTMSFVARWGDDDSTRGNCVTVTWAETPPLTVNGSAGPLTLNPNAPATPEFPDGAQWRAFAGASCTGDPVTEWSPDASSQSNGDVTWSFRARWGTDDATLGNCVDVTWRPATPTIMVNGQTTLIELQAGIGEVTIPGIPGARISVFVGSSCQADQLQLVTEVGEDILSGFSPAGTSFSIQAHWDGDTDSRGNCLTLTWTATPTLTVNGSAGPLTLNPNAPATPEFPDGAQWRAFAGASCTGDPVTEWSPDAASQINVDVTWSFRARWGTDDATLGNCVDVTWRPATPTPILNGEASSSLTLPLGSLLTVSLPDGALVAVFDGAICTDDPPKNWNNGAVIRLEEEGVRSFQARWGDDNDTRGECVTVTWVPVSEPTLASVVCGDNNDLITLPIEQRNISVSDTGWVDNQRTIRLVALGDYQFLSSQQTVFAYTDTGPCVTLPPVEPTQAKVCGIDNDTVTVPQQPTGVVFTQSDAWSDTHTWTVTFSAADNYVLPDGTKTEYVFTDAGLCETGAPIPPTWEKACGVDNDTVTILDQPDNVNVDDTGWVNGQRTVTFTAADDHVLPDGTKAEHTFTDAGPCVTLPPVEPTQAKVCGVDNDTVTVPTQPANIIVTQSDAWSDAHTWAVTFAAADGYVLPDGTKAEHTFTDAGPCVTLPPVEPTQAKVCGVDNDTVTILDQPDNVNVDDTGWVNGQRTVTFTAADDHVLPDGTKTEYVFTDAGPCVTLPPVEPTQAKVCGVDNDTVTVPTQPANIIVTQSDAWSDAHTWAVTFAAADGYVLPDGTKAEYVFTDAGPCVTLPPVEPTQAKVCGVDNDTVTIPDQPANVSVTDTDWVNGKRTVTFTAADNYVLPNGAKAEYLFTDAGPCETAAPVVPEWVAVCGVDNDTVTVPTQPANIIVKQSDAWSDAHTWTVTFAAADGYVLPDDAERDYTFTDSGPCQTDAPISPVQTAACGPDNDTLTLATELPTGVSFASDSGWSGNARTVSYAVDPAYVATGALSFSFTDDAEPCTYQVVISLIASDGAPLEGAGYQLFAPIAAQNLQPTPLRQGLVDANNQIVLSDLLAGEYMLSVRAEGYEPLDARITVTDGEGVQRIEAAMIAVQVPMTPAPSPTPASPEPSPTPVTPEPTTAVPGTPTPPATEQPDSATPISVDPTATTAVSALPSTGSGTNSGVVAVILGTLAAAVLSVGILRQRPGARW